MPITRSGRDTTAINLQDYLRHLLKDNENVFERKDKVLMVERMYHFLSRNMEWVKSHPNLYQVTRDKLFELTVIEKWKGGRKYWDIFDIDIDYVIKQINERFLRT